MESLEIPLGKRTKRYRFFEMLPALLSYTILLLPFVLSFFSPFLASIYVLLVIFGMFVKAIRIGWHTVRGYRWYGSAIQVDWHQRLMDLADPQAALERLDDQMKALMASSTWQISTKCWPPPRITQPQVALPTW